MTVASHNKADEPARSESPRRERVCRIFRSLLRFRPLQLAALVVFLTAIGGFAFYTKLCVIDNDIWWHLKVGDWIVEHLAVPHTGILSRTAAGRPWIAYSWGYEVLMSCAYRWFGILGIGLYGTLLTSASRMRSTGCFAGFPGASGLRCCWRRSPAGRSCSMECRGRYSFR